MTLLLLSFFSDIRSVKGDQERVKSFKSHVEAYTLFLSASNSKIVEKKPYMHYLRNHVPALMEVALDKFGFGYGMYSCNAGEHLNKIVKTMELTHTNLGSTHFRKIIRNLRLKQFVYSKTIKPHEVTVTCSRCNQKGHNRKNKMCPLHPIHPEIEFSESEDEEDEN